MKLLFTYQSDISILKEQLK